MKTRLRKFLKAEDGVAAIEMAFIFPFMVLLYFGMVDVTALINFNRKVTAVAGMTADMVAQQKTSILKSQIDDIYNAVSLIMSPTVMSDVHVEVTGLRNTSGVMSKVWTTSNGQGPACPTAIVPADYLALTAAGNDIVVARTCMVFTPYVTAFMGNTILGATSFSVRATISQRPRSSLVLNCYATTVAAGTLCS